MLLNMVDIQDWDCSGNECYNSAYSQQHILPVRVLFKFFVLHSSKVLTTPAVCIDCRQEITLIRINALVSLVGWLMARIIWFQMVNQIIARASIDLINGFTSFWNQKTSSLRDPYVWKILKFWIRQVNKMPKRLKAFLRNIIQTAGDIPIRIFFPVRPKNVIPNRKDIAVVGVRFHYIKRMMNPCAYSE